jgi:hypothetical protein
MRHQSNAGAAVIPRLRDRCLVGYSAADVENEAHTYKTLSMYLAGILSW